MSKKLFELWERILWFFSSLNFFSDKFKAKSFYWLSEALNFNFHFELFCLLLYEKLHMKPLERGN